MWQTLVLKLLEDFFGILDEMPTTEERIVFEHIKKELFEVGVVVQGFTTLLIDEEGSDDEEVFSVFIHLYISNFQPTVSKICFFLFKYGNASEHPGPFQTLSEYYFESGLITWMYQGWRWPATLHTTATNACVLTTLIHRSSCPLLKNYNYYAVLLLVTLLVRQFVCLLDNMYYLI